MTKDGFNLKALFPSYDGKSLQRYPDAGDEIILCVFTTFFCTVGLVGNGNIICLLGFRIKRKPFAIYILNLAVADFGSLLFLLLVNISVNTFSFSMYRAFPIVLHRILITLFAVIYKSRQHLLAAISIDRWLFILFPNWYQRHQSPLLPTLVCTFIWALPFALIGVPLILLSVDLIPDYGYEILGGYVATTLICFILVIISTLTLLIKVCSKLQPCQCGNLLKVILLILLSSVLITILSYVCQVLLPRAELAYYGLWISLKGSINPLIYFLAGRQNGGQFQQRMKATLQRVFKEERNIRMEWPPHTQMSKL